MNILKKIAQFLTSKNYSLTPYSPITLLIIIVGSYYMQGWGRTDVEGLPKTKSKYEMKPGDIFPRKMHEYPNTSKAGRDIP